MNSGHGLKLEVLEWLVSLPALSRAKIVVVRIYLLF